MRRLALSGALTLGLTTLACAGDWPAWRGPEGNGHCQERNLPLTWSPTENVRWKVKLPGQGNSTPIVWGERIFITQSLDKEGKRRATLCFDRKQGKKLWEQVIDFGQKETTHSTNPYCSASPATDGERVVVSHGSAGVFCYNLDGKELWRRELGKFEHIWGNAASPVLHENLVILNCGPGERTFLLAMDKHTGKDVWEVLEPGGKFGEKNSEWIGSWSTPVVAKLHGRTQLIMSWPEAVKAYDPKDGKLLWSCKGLSKLVYTSPIVSPEVIVAMSGFHGPALALRAPSTLPARAEEKNAPDLTSTERLWRVGEKMPQRIGSGVILGEHIYMANAGPGTLHCIELRTGKALWEERLGVECWGSIVLADGRLYVTDVAGDTFVVAAKPTYELLARNVLKERTLASPAISNGEIFLRTYGHLWCIGRK